MAIDKVGGRLPIIHSNDGKSKINGKKDGKPEVQDKVQLSEEAKSLFGADRAKKIGTIQANIESGFYETPEVTEKVVEGLLRDLTRQPRS
jgi:hypothetical protein